MRHVAPPLAELTAQAQSLTSVGDLAGARDVLADVLDPADADPQRASPDLALAAALQARILIALGDPHAARLWAGFAHAAEERLHGPRDERTVAATATFAAVLQRIGNHGRAAQLYHDLVEVLTAKDGRLSARVLAAEADLATAEHSAGQCTSARARLADAWARHQEAYGDAAPAGIKMLARLGAMERECGRAADARAHLHQAQELCARHLPADHPLAQQVARLAGTPASGRHACGRVQRSTGPIPGGPASGVTRVPATAPGVQPVPRDPPEPGDLTGRHARPEPPIALPLISAEPPPETPRSRPVVPPQRAPEVPAVPPQQPPGEPAVPPQQPPGEPAVPGPPPVPAQRHPGLLEETDPPATAPAPGESPETAFPDSASAQRTETHETGFPDTTPARHAETHETEFPDTMPAQHAELHEAEFPVTTPAQRESWEAGPELPEPQQAWLTNNWPAETTPVGGSLDVETLDIGQQAGVSPGDPVPPRTWAPQPPGPWPPDSVPPHAYPPDTYPPGPRIVRRSVDRAPADRATAPVNDRLLPVPVERPDQRPSRQPFVLAAVVAAGIAVAAAIVAATLPRDEGGAVAEPAGQPTASAPVATTASVTPSSTAAAPDAVKLRDNRDSVSLTWRYPKGAEGPVLISGGRAGQERRAFQQLPAGTNDYVVYGLNPRNDYCFTVAVVYTVDQVAASPAVCTNRS
jgi:hypothetical protein